MIENSQQNGSLARVNLLQNRVNSSFETCKGPMGRGRGTHFFRLNILYLQSTMISPYLWVFKFLHSQEPITKMGGWFCKLISNSDNPHWFNRCLNRPKLRLVFLFPPSSQRHPSPTPTLCKQNLTRRPRVSWYKSCLAGWLRSLRKHNLQRLTFLFFGLKKKIIIICDYGLDFMRTVTCQSSSLRSEGHLNPRRQYGHVLSNMSRIISVKDQLVFCHRSEEISETVLIFNHISSGMFYGVTK